MTDIVIIRFNRFFSLENRDNVTSLVQSHGGTVLGYAGARSLKVKMDISRLNRIRGYENIEKVEYLWS